jgi:hypothetical protein
MIGSGFGILTAGPGRDKDPKKVTNPIYETFRISSSPESLNVFMIKG